MNRLLADLLQLLELERLEINLFRGESRDIGSPQVFGGQVLGQALMAASRTVEERAVHSLHAYFLRRGDFNAPIVYEVDRSRDGAQLLQPPRGRDPARPADLPHVRVVPGAGRGPDHQVPMPEVPPPEELPDLTADGAASSSTTCPTERRRFWSRERPFEFRSVEPVDGGEPRPGVRHVWFRLVGPLPGRRRCCIAACWPTCRTTTCSRRRRCRTACRIARAT